MKKFELAINENTKLLVECRKTEFCSRWCELFLLHKNKLNSGHRSFNSLYLGDVSMEKLSDDLMEADKKGLQMISRNALQMTGQSSFG